MKIITRLQAIEINQKWFYDGIPCSKGHLDKKSVSRWKCYQCAREYKKQFAVNNPQKVKEAKKASYMRNKEAIAKKAKEKYSSIKEERKAYLKEYYINNKDKFIKKAKIQAEENKERVAGYKKKHSKTEKGMISLKVGKANRRALEKKAGVLLKEEIKSIINNAHKCYWCENKIDTTDRAKFHLDHYIPLACGGKNTIENIVVSCPKCNMNKNAKDPFEFANSKGKLL